MTTKKIVEALGLKWTLTENSELADIERGQMERRASAFAMSHTKPSEKSAAYRMLDGYYADIMSSVESVESLDDREVEEFYLLNLVDSPAYFFEIAKLALKEGNFGEIKALYQAAQDCNPHWHPVLPLENAPEEVGQAAAELEEAQAHLDLENSSDEGIDPAAVLENSEIVVSYAEEKAVEAGKIGPATFSKAAAKRQLHQ